MKVVAVSLEEVPGRVFDYAVPEELSDGICPGLRIRVPFGKKETLGYVIAVAERERENLPLFSGEADSGDEKPNLRYISGIDSPHPFLSPALIELARFTADYYCAPLGTAIRCVLPAPVRSGKSKPKEQFFVSPVVPAPEIKLTPKQKELLENIRRVDGGWLQHLCREFGCSAGMFHTLAAHGAIEIEKKQQRRNPLANRKILPTAPLALTDEQAEALRVISEEIEVTDRKPKPVLLFGVTGSGKTEVYLQAIAKVLEKGGSSIVMVPEIALTPQTVQRFTARFGGQVAVLHSALSDGERYDEWHRIRRGEAKIVVGPRSAVFAPVGNLGLIVVDEEHEPSYKQEETPRYHARDIAVMRAVKENCAVVLGTATPSMETWVNVRRGKYRKAVLLRRVMDRPLPFVQIVDMRTEMQKTGHPQLFSELLIEAMRQRLERGEQIILFLNRRGYSSSLQCPACGHKETCESCSVTMTYHKTDDCLRCHICGAWRRPPPVCPACGSPAFKYAGFGTQRVENILSAILPQARVLRMDADSTARRHGHDEILSLFQSGRADILIGTQMIAKGHHFPNVTLVGVLAADMSLHQPDFRAAERTFQLLAQVSGRSGRGEIPGEVFIQTYTPDHPAVIHSRTADFERFAEVELAEREQWGYPPFCHLVLLSFFGESEATVSETAARYETALRKQKAGEISPAVPAPLTRAKGNYRYQIIVRNNSVQQILNALRAVMKTYPPGTAVGMIADVDALGLS